MSKNQYAMQDPLTLYPRPKLKDQRQSPPGLARDMVPRPDHGEDSYKGFGRLAGRHAPTKTAITAFTHALAKQVVGKGIRVNAVAPGPFWTPLQSSGGQPAKNTPEFGEEVPMKRPGQPAGCAPIYVLLASQESSFVTGEVYGVTGGNPIS
jgi:NAD(P)-dependent dehydrogenase (short-subunit alcohol dehydrogenase family)